METILKTSENTDKFWPAFIKAKHEMGQPELNCFNPHFKAKYADLSSCFKTIKIPFKTNDLDFVQTFGSSNNQGILETRIIHVSGQWIAAQWTFNVDSNIQKLGAQFTYLKRYHLYSMLGLAGEEDTDGQTISRDTGKVKPLVHEKRPYDPKTEPYDFKNPDHNTVLFPMLKSRNIDPKDWKEIIHAINGKKSDEWAPIIKKIMESK